MNPRPNEFNCLEQLNSDERQWHALEGATVTVHIEGAGTPRQRGIVAVPRRHAAAVPVKLALTASKGGNRP
jgi:hypothetical protein